MLKRRRYLTAALAAVALVALSGAAIARPLAQSGPEVAFGGFDYSGGVAESGTLELTFAGTEFGATSTASGAVVLPGFAVGALCFEDNDGLPNVREEAAGTNPCLFDTDGDGLADGGDVEFIQTAVAALPRDAFGDSRAQGTSNAIQSLLNEIETQLLAGAVGDAKNKVENLRRRLDGCASPSGTADTNDWIVVCPSQLSIRADIDLLALNISP